MLTDCPFLAALYPWAIESFSLMNFPWLVFPYHQSDVVHRGTERRVKFQPTDRIGNISKKRGSIPCLKTLRLTPQLTGKLRERARQEGTNVHGALAAASALAYWH